MILLLSHSRQPVKVVESLPTREASTISLQQQLQCPAQYQKESGYTEDLANIKNNYFINKEKAKDTKIKHIVLHEREREKH